jgi:hypothetical protein
VYKNAGRTDSSELVLLMESAELEQVGNHFLIERFLDVTIKLGRDELLLNFRKWWHSREHEDYLVRIFFVY